MIDDFVNRIINGDSVSILKNIDTESIDLIFADPPFNLSKNYGEDINDSLSAEDYQIWVNEWLKECCRILKNTGSIYVMNIQENIWMFQEALYRIGFHFRNTVVWKNSSMPVKNRYCINYQPIIFYTKSDKYTFNYDAESHLSSAALPWGKKNNGNLMIDQWNDIPFISGGCMASKEAILSSDSKKKAHPAQMPIKLAARIIKFSSNVGDIVLDPFVGSGTTAVAAKELNRKYIGIDKSPDFCKIANDRLNGIVFNQVINDEFVQKTFDMEDE